MQSLQKVLLTIEFLCKYIAGKVSAGKAACVFPSDMEGVFVLGSDVLVHKVVPDAH